MYLVVNHHGDKPILNSGRIKIEVRWRGELQIYFCHVQPGSDADVQILPSYTTTTEDAISSFTPEERNCYSCSEVTSKIVWVRGEVMK